MGPRIREDTGGGGFLPAFSRGWDQCGDDGGDGLREWGPCNEILRLRCAALRMTWGVFNSDLRDNCKELKARNDRKK